MSNKRKDNKGRVLHNGEYQQSNGRYRFKYYDGIGKERYLYSWRLDKNDRMPEGKRQGKGYSTIHTIRGILRPAFRQAYDDDLIRRNPFDFELATVIVNDSVIREAITRENHSISVA